MDRKAFLSTIGRVSILAMMTAMVGTFVSRDKVTLRSGCAFNSHCKGCEKLAGCALPAAEKERDNGKG